MNNLFTPEELITAVDEIASIKAKISDLKQREEIYKAVLVASDCAAVDGTQHSASISWSARTSINWEAIARAAIKKAVEDRVLVTTSGPRNSILHILNPSHRRGRTDDQH